MRKFKICNKCRFRNNYAEDHCEYCGETWDTTAVRNGKHGISSKAFIEVFEEEDEEEDDDIRLLKQFGYLE